MELERDVEQYLVHRVETLGGLCIKHGQDGWPDRIVVLPGGALVWVETKRHHGRLSPVQIYRATQLAKLGQQVISLWSTEEVDEFMTSIASE